MTEQLVEAINADWKKKNPFMKLYYTLRNTKSEKLKNKKCTLINNLILH